MSLPMLMSSRSPSPYLPPGQLRGRSPRSKRVMVHMQSEIPDHSMLLRSIGQALPVALRNNMNVQPLKAELLSPACGHALPAVRATDIGKALTLDMRCNKTLQDGLRKNRFPEAICEDTQREQKAGDYACTDSPKVHELHAQKQMDGDGQALLAVEGSSANDDPLNRLCARLKARRATKTHELFMLLLLLPFVFMCTSLHQALRGQASDQYHDRFVKYGTTATSADWDVLRRASARSHWRTGRWIWVSEDPDSNPAAASSTHRLEQSQGSPVFFLDTAALAVLLPFQTRTLVVPIQTGTWQACVGERFQAIQCDQALLAKILGESSFTLNGRTLPADYDLGALTDTTLRLRLIGLPGGMPGSSGDSEFAGLAKKALMKRATDLGVPTRTGQGNARTWRPMADVRRDCEQNIAGLSSSSQALPGASSSLPVIDTRPREEAPIIVESSSEDSE